MSDVKKSVVITPEVLEEMISSYVMAKTGHNPSGLKCNLTLPDSEMDQARCDLLGAVEKKTLPVCVVTWDN